MSCAACGIAEDDDIELKTCTACKSVRYCSVTCQKEHRSKHKRACKKRAAELRDEILFKQPESSHLGDCPICCLPLKLDHTKSNMMPCCSKIICAGCEYANFVREQEAGLKHTCPFCRHPMAKSEEEANRTNVKRAESSNDPAAIHRMGARCYKEGDYESAFEYFYKAAGLGSVTGHYMLSTMYRNGQGGIKKDKKKELYHLEEASIGGHPTARNNLGCVEEENGRLDRAAKHWIIATKLGDDIALSSLRVRYTRGLVEKDDYASALRGHQAAVDATESPQRDKGEAYFKLGRDLIALGYGEKN